MKEESRRGRKKAEESYRKVREEKIKREREQWAEEEGRIKSGDRESVGAGRRKKIIETIIARSIKRRFSCCCIHCTHNEMYTKKSKKKLEIGRYFLIFSCHSTWNSSSNPTRNLYIASITIKMVIRVSFAIIISFIDTIVDAVILSHFSSSTPHFCRIALSLPLSLLSACARFLTFISTPRSLDLCFFIFFSSFVYNANPRAGLVNKKYNISFIFEKREFAWSFSISALPKA